jgi:hypothetical protein
MLSLVRSIPAFAFLTIVVAGCSRTDPSASTLTNVSIMGEVGTSPGQFAFPRALDTDGKSLWVIDKAGRVQRFDLASGKCVEYWGMPKTEFGKPTGVTVFAGDPPLLFIPDTHYQRVMVFAVAPLPDQPLEGTMMQEAPKPITTFGSRGKGPGEFIYPTDIAVLPTEDGKRPARLYIAEYGDNDRVSIYEPDGQGGFAFKSSFGVWGSAEDFPDEPSKVVFNRPQSVSLDLSKRELIVADAGNHRLGRFTLDGTLIKWVGGATKADDSPVHYPWAIQALGDGTAIVVEQVAARLQRIDLTTGESLGTFGGPGPSPGQFATPWAIAVIGSRMFVADGGNNRVMTAALPPAGPHKVAGGMAGGMADGAADGVAHLGGTR